MRKVERVFEAYLDAMDVVTILLPHERSMSHRFWLKYGENTWELDILHVVHLPAFTKYECSVGMYVKVGQSYIVMDEHGYETDLQIGAVIRTEEFDAIYHYAGDDLGAVYGRESSDFKVWSPTASTAKLRIYEHDGYKEYEMERKQQGIWYIHLPGDWEGAHYTFVVCINLVWREAVDPYAKAVSVNGTRGIVVDMSKTSGICEDVLPPLSSFTDAIIYEAHIRDLTVHSDSGVQKKGTYMGVVEEGTVSRKGAPTGLSYIKELGITHLELLPFNDFEGVDELCPSSSYNWGYNPLHFNAPEGSYSSNPNAPYSRIVELKQMIASLHAHGIRVIMDVVYNHVYIREDSSFEKLVPGYYFRHDDHGMPSNGTGVGNDIASERKMVQKFIIDSVLYWLQEYNVDGFRFDLMGILDWETMNRIRQKVDAIRPGIVILGEGWELNTPLDRHKKATLFNARRMPHIAQFNDRFRDRVKGSTFMMTDRGYALGNEGHIEEIKRLISGSISVHDVFEQPSQSVNYVESHDNCTMWDKLSISNEHESEHVRQRRHMLATTMTLLSQGIPFLHAGQEFFRTKHGVENSYNAPDEINAMDWNRMEEHRHAVKYMKGIIGIRNAHGAFRLPSARLVRKHLHFLPAPSPVIVYELRDVGVFGAWNHLLVIFHSGTHAQTIHLPAGEWTVLADNRAADAARTASCIERSISVAPISSYVLARM